MDPITFGTIAMGVGDVAKMFSGLMDNSGHTNAMLTYRKANLMQSALEENMRRAEGRETQVMSSTKSRMAGSGLDFNSGSFMDYLNGMATEFQKQNAFERKQGTEQIDATRAAAYMMDSNVATRGKSLIQQAGGDAKKAFQPFSPDSGLGP